MMSEKTDRQSATAQSGNAVRSEWQRPSVQRIAAGSAEVGTNPLGSDGSFSVS